MTSSNEQDTYSTAIAIIGMSGRFPGARDISTFWENIAAGVKSIRRFSDEELLAAGVDPAQLAAPNYVKAGAILDDVDKFDASFFGFAPRDAETMDPQHRFFLECAWEALEDAAYDPANYPGLISVFAGSGFSTYLLNNLYQNPDLADIADPLLSAVGNERDALASMVSYKMNLKGPSFSVHTFCSTSLVAVHLACQSLLNYECDIALAGGVAIQVPHLTGYLYKEGGIVSPDGECRTFDASANGSVVGNGIGVVTLKRLSEALEDQDHIYAVIRGSAANNDGSQRVSYTAPGLDGQSEVIAEAIGNSGVDIETISYLEAHGTGTMLGDAVELAALKKAFASSTDKTQFCAIGSVKPNIGHLDRASGVTGLIKTSLALQHKFLPASLNFVRASADIDLDSSPFYVNTQAREWISTTDAPLRAGVNSFGLGGTNVHVVLEEAPASAATSASRPWQLLLLSAKTEQALDATTLKLANYLQQADTDLSDVAYTLQAGRSVFNHRRFLVCQDKQEAVRILQNPALEQMVSKHQTMHAGTVAFLFPGIGEQYVGMAQDLYQQEPVFRETVTMCCSWLEQHLQLNLLEYLYPTPNKGRRRSGRLVVETPTLNATELADPATFVIEYALAQLLISWGIQPAAMLGYSLGEYVAACVAGVISLEDALWLVTQRARLIATQPAGTMLAVALSADTVQSYLDEDVSLAAINGPRLSVLSGSMQAIELLEERFARQNVECQRVDVTHALHSTQMSVLQSQLVAFVREVKLSAPEIPYISNLTGTWITAEQATDPTYWADHMCQIVQFAMGVDLLVCDTNHVLLEVGPGQSLSTIVSRYAKSKDHGTARIMSTLPAANSQKSAYTSLLRTLGLLWLEDVQPVWSKFYTHEQRQRLSLPTYPFERQSYWVDPPQHQLVTHSGHSSASEVASTAEGKTGESANWFYRLDWEATPPLSAPIVAQQGPWLVFDDETPVGEAIIQHLQRAGRQVIRVQAGSQFARLDNQRFTVRADVQDDYASLSSALGAFPPISTVLHLWNTRSAVTESGGVDTFKFWQDRGLYSLIFLMKALGMQLYDTQIAILVASTGINDVTGSEQLTPEKETLIGACKVISQEYLNVTCRSIDFEHWDDEHSLWLGETLLLERQADNSDYVVAYRERTRHRQAFVQTPLTMVPAQKPAHVFRRHGVYLITGGLGGVGLVLAHYLAREVQARLVLVGSSAFPAREDWSDWLATHDEHDMTRLRIEHLQTVESLGGQVMIAQADVADVAQLEAVLEQANRKFGRIHGVIHAAGTSARSAFGTIQEIGPEQCEMHFKPKVYGLYALEQALGDRDLDFCLLFSSLASILGGLGFVGYTAANIFMDAFARKHNREAATIWTSVNWDTWLLKADAHGDLGATVAKFAMLPEEGANAFLHVLAYRNITHLINSTGDLHARVRQWITLEAEKQPVNPTEKRKFSRPAMSTEYVAPSDGYEQLVVEVWQQVLGINQIGVHDNFFELGGHSLMGTQLISRLRKAFQMEIPLGMLFESPTVAELTAIIKQMVLDEMEKQQAKEVLAN